MSPATPPSSSNEAFSVKLSQPDTGTVIGTGSARGVIRNDDLHNDDSSLSIVATSADKSEGDLGATPFTFTVTRAGDMSGSASVHWAVTGTQVFDSDFIPFEELLSSAEEISQTASDLGVFFPRSPPTPIPPCRPSPCSTA